MLARSQTFFPYRLVRLDLCLPLGPFGVLVPSDRHYPHTLEPSGGIVLGYLQTHPFLPTFHITLACLPGQGWEPSVLLLVLVQVPWTSTTITL